MSKMALELTKDQSDWLFRLLDYELQQEIHHLKKTLHPDKQRKHVAFVRRIRNKLAKAKIS